MASVLESKQGRGVCANRIELIHMITNLIEEADIRLIEDRDDAAMLAGHIVNGIEDEAKKLEARMVTKSEGSINMKRTFCDGCGSRIEIGAAIKSNKNLDIHIGDYQVGIYVSKDNNLLDLCQKCLCEVVSYCVLETDPFVSRTEDVTIQAMLDARRIAEHSRSRDSRTAAAGDGGEK